MFSVLLPLVLSVSFASAGALSSRNADPAPVVLEPIHDSLINKRSMADLSALDPSQLAHLIYGAPLSSSEEMLLANLTLHAKDGQPIIAMERFDDMTTSVDCNDDDGVLGLTFMDEEAFNYAITSWGWVNEEDERTFLLIANHEGCGKDSERAPYLIYDVDYDEAALTTTLSAQLSSWNDTASSFEIGFAKAAADSATQRKLLRRFDFGDLNPIGEITSVFNEATSAVLGVASTLTSEAVAAATSIASELKDQDIDKSVSWDFDSGEEGKRVTLFADPFKNAPRLKIDCVDCQLRGSIDFSGHVKVENFVDVTELTWVVDPKELYARMELNVQILKSIYDVDLSDLKVSKNIFSVPLGGIVVPEIFSFGPKLDFEMGFEMGVSSMVNFTFGMETTVPETAIINGDLLAQDKTTAEGWDETTVTPVPFDISSARGTVNAGVFAMPVLSMGFNVLDTLGFETSLKLKAPTVNVNASAIYDEAGACKDDAAKTTTALTIGSAAAVELWFYVGEDKLVNEKDLFQRKLWAYKYPFLDLCYPIEIPGFTGNNETSTNGTTPTRRWDMAADGELMPRQLIEERS